MATAAGAHTIYIANDDHTDYGWNATTDTYDTAMLSAIDYYLGRITATAANPPRSRPASTPIAGGTCGSINRTARRPSSRS